MGKIIGIDLGTTNSCVAVLEGGKAIVIPNTEGARTTPSMVAFTENGDRLVGQVAKRQAVTNAANTLYAVKRLIGQRFDADEVQKALDQTPFSIVASESGDAWLEVRGNVCSPPEISSLILQKMKDVAEDYIGEPIERAVITVPAHFNDSQRQATRDAGKIAGLEVERIINEPTAAALAYGAESKGDRKIAIYDLGGGTFDISILDLSDGVFNVLATTGDTHLGGEDFDRLIIEFVCAQFLEDTQIDLRQDKVALQRIKEAAEKAKHELSSSDETEINLPFIIADANGPRHLNTLMTRDVLEKLTEPLVARTLQPCAEALKDAGLEPSAIEEVLLVGGMTRMPLVQRKVESFFGKAPNREINPDEVVAIGAALQGGVLAGDVQDVLLLDVTPLSLGVETAGGVSTVLIPRNATIPCKKTQVFSTAQDNQPVVNVHVVQGERSMADDNVSLARFELVGIPPAPRGVPQIEVAFELDANGIVHVGAKDLGTGKSQSIKITAQGGLKSAEVEARVAEAKAQREADEVKKQAAEVRTHAEGLIYTTERSLAEYGDQLDEVDRELIAGDLENLKEALASDDEMLIEASFKALEGSAYRIAEAIYGDGETQGA